jgi:beta-lactamase regulating signal transducer with metallopeptidase domain
MFWWLAQNTILAAALAGVVALGCRWVRPGPALRHTLWLVVLLKLITPPLVQWPWPAPDFWPAEDTPAAVTEDPYLEQSLRATPTRTDPLVPRRTVEAVSVPAKNRLPPRNLSLPHHATYLSQDPEVREAGRPPGVVAVVLCLWLTGSVLLAIFQLRRILRFGRLTAQGQAAPPALQEQVREMAARLQVKPPRTLVVEGLGSPCVWGLGWPTLLWPACLLERLPAERARAIAVHELAHLRRRDHWVRWLELLAGCLWWWNPLFWYVRRQLRQNAELACDAWVVSLLPASRRAYAEALLEVSQLLSRSAAPVPALGMGGQRRDFERRLVMIMRERLACQVSRPALLVVGVLALIVLPGWSLGQKTAESEPQTAPPGTTAKGPAPKQEAPKADAVVNLLATVAELSQQEAAQPDRDKKLQELEKKLQDLLKEVQALRSSSSPKTKEDPQTQAIQTWLHLTARRQSAATLLEITREQPVVLKLTRVTYPLPKDKAEALAAFLRQHVKASVLETKVEGDNLIVTTTPDTQQAIGQVVALIQGKRAPSGGSGKLKNLQTK